MDKFKLLIGNPSYDRSRMNVSAQLVAHRGTAIVETIHAEMDGSALTFSFNQLWCAALNGRRSHGVTHFLLWHADVKPIGDDWLNVMFQEMSENEADVLSAIIPIKDSRGLTSTALDNGDQWRPLRLTQKQVWSKDLPDTWTAEGLMFNTGLMLVDFRKPWVEKICFTMKDKIELGKDGIFRAYCESEDWNFSRQCAALGVNSFVTRKVVTEHYGITRFRSDQIWGNETDIDNGVAKQTFEAVEA